MSPVDAADLRVAALSDRKHPPATSDTPGLLDVLLPDVPGEPYGGQASPAQIRATTAATGRALPSDHLRVSTLRNALRRWALAQAHPPAPAPAQPRPAATVHFPNSGDWHLTPPQALALQSWLVRNVGKDARTSHAAAGGQSLTAPPGR